MRIISRADLEQLVPIGLAIEAVADAFAQLSGGAATVPPRQHIGLPEAEALALIMPARLSDAFGVKLLTLFPHNRGSNTPTIQAVVVLFDVNNGTPLALMDGTYLTTLRTGAASGVATQHMARHDARVLALFGAGATALRQVLAVCTVRAIERIWLVNRTREHAERLAARLLEYGAPVPHDVRIATSPTEALREADVVCLATASPTPVFDDTDLRAGTHINGIGSYQASMQEVPAATVARAYIVVDQRAAAWAEAGDLAIPRDQGLINQAHIVAELGEVASGRAVGRLSEKQITFFKSVGNAAQDVAVAQLAYKLASEQGLGTMVDL